MLCICLFAGKLDHKITPSKHRLSLDSTVTLCQTELSVINPSPNLQWKGLGQYRFHAWNQKIFPGGWGWGWGGGGWGPTDL